VFSIHLWPSVHNHLHKYVNNENVAVALELTTIVFPWESQNLLNLSKFSDVEEHLTRIRKKAGEKGDSDGPDRALTAIYLALEQSNLIKADSRVQSGIGIGVHREVQSKADLALSPLGMCIWAQVLLYSQPAGYRFGPQSTQADMFLWHERLVQGIMWNTGKEMEFLRTYLDIYTTYYYNGDDNGMRFTRSDKGENILESQPLYRDPHIVKEWHRRGFPTASSLKINWMIAVPVAKAPQIYIAHMEELYCLVSDGLNLPPTCAPSIVQIPDNDLSKFLRYFCQLKKLFAYISPKKELVPTRPLKRAMTQHRLIGRPRWKFQATSKVMLRIMPGMRRQAERAVTRATMRSLTLQQRYNRLNPREKAWRAPAPAFSDARLKQLRAIAVAGDSTAVLGLTPVEYVRLKRLEEANIPTRGFIQARKRLDSLLTTLKREHLDRLMRSRDGWLGRLRTQLASVIGGTSLRKEVERLLEEEAVLNGSIHALVLMCKRLVAQIYSDFGGPGDRMSVSSHLNVEAFASRTFTGTYFYPYRAVLVTALVLSTIQTHILDTMALDVMYAEHVESVEAVGKEVKALDSALVVGLDLPGLMEVWHLFFRAGVKTVTGVHSTLDYTSEYPVLLDRNTVEWLRWVLGTGFTTLFSPTGPNKSGLRDWRNSAGASRVNPPEGAVARCELERAVRDRLLTLAEVVAWVGEKSRKVKKGNCHLQLVYGVDFHRLEVDGSATRALLTTGSQELLHKLAERDGREKKEGEKDSCPDGVDWVGAKVVLQRTADCRSRGDCHEGKEGSGYLRTAAFKLLVCADGPKSEACRDRYIGLVNEAHPISYSTGILRLGMEVRKMGARVLWPEKVLPISFQVDSSRRLIADRMAPHLKGINELVEGSACFDETQKLKFAALESMIEEQIRALEKLPKEQKGHIGVNYVRNLDYALSVRNVPALTDFFQSGNERIASSGVAATEAEACSGLRSQVSVPNTLLCSHVQCIVCGV